MELNKQELEFIHRASSQWDRIYDYEWLDRDFRRMYGITKTAATNMAEKLKAKTSQELGRKPNGTTIHALQDAISQANVKLHKMFSHCSKSYEIIAPERIIQTFLCHNGDKNDFSIIEIQIVKKKEEVIILFSKTEAFDELTIPVK
jgi:hypothetical protein